MDLINITPDKEKARSILKMASLIEERIQKQDREKMAALIIVDYYEIIKEIITSILLIDGFKTLSHRDLIDYLQKKYPGFNTHEISILHNLRVLRNRAAYEGFLIDISYLNRNESFFKKIIQKLKEVVKRKL